MTGLRRVTCSDFQHHLDLMVSVVVIWSSSPSWYLFLGSCRDPNIVCINILIMTKKSFLFHIKNKKYLSFTMLCSSLKNSCFCVTFTLEELILFLKLFIKFRSPTLITGSGTLLHHWNLPLLLLNPSSVASEILFMNYKYSILRNPISFACESKKFYFFNLS